MTTKTVLRLSILFICISVCGQTHASAQTLKGYYCVPFTCLQIDPGTGYFGTNMSMTGTWLINDGSGHTTSKTIWKLISSLGCNLTVTLTVFGETTNSDIFGDGILVDATGVQLGVTLIESTTTKYLYSQSTVTQPSPSVPCI